MNILTADIISVIATRNFTKIKHNKYTEAVSYIDQNGHYHRINGPARIWNDGSWIWYFHGLAHRDRSKPAVKSYYDYIWYNMDDFVAKRKKNKN